MVCRLKLILFAHSGEQGRGCESGIVALLIFGRPFGRYACLPFRMADVPPSANRSASSLPPSPKRCRIVCETGSVIRSLNSQRLDVAVPPCSMLNAPEQASAVSSCVASGKASRLSNRALFQCARRILTFPGFALAEKGPNRIYFSPRSTRARASYPDNWRIRYSACDSRPVPDLAGCRSTPTSHRGWRVLDRGLDLHG